MNGNHRDRDQPASPQSAFEDEVHRLVVACWNICDTDLDGIAANVARARAQSSLRPSIESLVGSAQLDEVERLVNAAKVLDDQIRDIVVRESGQQEAREGEAHD